MAMSAQDLMDTLQNFDMEQLNDFNNVGSWPMAVKIIIWVICFVGVMFLGYFLHVTNLQNDLKGVQTKETQLRTDFESKYFEAVHLEGYRRQQKEMEESFEAILRQLPSDTEIPGLIEDITLVGLKNGLAFERIDLQPEQVHEFYVEKPIEIVVKGGYHDLGAFVSDVSDLSRIVTLHDFAIKPAPDGRRRGNQDRGEGQRLEMKILAKTYRYNDARG